MSGLKDAEVLALCARDGYVLVTHDHKTMPKHFGDFIQLTSSPGLIVVSQSLAVKDVADDLILVWLASQPEEWINRLVYLLYESRIERTGSAPKGSGTWVAARQAAVL